VDFEATGQLLIIHSTFVIHLRKKREYNEAVHQLLIDFQKATDSIRRAVLYVRNILFEFDIPMQLVRPVEHVPE
jgi:hypothetical protein